MSSDDHVILREAALSDSHEIARLLTQLGHPTTNTQIVERWPMWEGEGNGALVAACGAGKLIGLCTVHQMRVLHRPKPLGRITALVVDESKRGEGIGRMLVAAVEDHFARAGCGLLELTSNFTLADAHAFYENLGYEKTSYRLVRELAK